MQTSPVANLISSPSTTAASKQAESNSGVTPFNDVLSREVASQRNTNESPKPESNANSANSANSANAANAQPSGNAKAPDSKTQAADKSKNKTQDSSETASEDGADAAAGATTPADMLALVASMQKIVPAAPGATATAATGPAAALDAATPSDATAGLLAAAGTARPDKPVRTTATDTDTSKLGDALTQRQSTGRDKNGKAESDAALKAGDMPATAKPTADAALKVAEAAAGASTPKADFATDMKEALATPTASGLQQMQPALSNAAQAAAGPVTDKLTPSVGTPAWDQALGQKVVWMVAGEHQSASLTLNPPDLGPLQVVLNVSNSQASATFTAAQPEVRQALEAALPRLREMLGEAGIQLGQASVNSGAPNQQGSQEQRQSHATPRGDAIGASGIEASLRTSRMPVAASGRGLVDTFV